MRKVTNIDIKAKHALNISLRFLSDGSIIVKKGSTTIQKNGSSATIIGGLTKEFKEDVVENINLVQKSFTSWMSELREASKGGLRAYYHGEELLITSIKYTMVVTKIVEESLPVKPESDAVPVMTSKDGTKDSEQPLSEFVSNEQEVLGEEDLGEEDLGNLNNPGRGASGYSKLSDCVKSVNISRSYSTKASSPYEKINIAPVVNHVCLYHRVPSLIRLERGENGSFYFEGLNSTNLLHSQRLKEILNGIIGIIRELESVNDKGYINSTRLSDYPVLSGYLRPYVKSKFLEKLDDGALARLSESEKSSVIDKELTLREKRVLIIWFYSLFNLNLFYLIIDVLNRLGSANTELLSEELKDLIEDLKTYAGKLYGNISPSIRESMRQRGITVSKNIYCGFDTEYKNIDMKENKILSAQWAVNSKLTLTMPYYTDYDLSGMNTNSGEIYPINSMWFDQEKIDFSSFQEEIRGFILKVREIRFASNDISLKSITNGLIKDGIPYFIENGRINFSFSRTPIKTYFKISDFDKLDLKKLVQIGINLESKDMDSKEERLYSLLKTLNVSIDNIDNIEKPEYNLSNLTPPDGSSTEIIGTKVEELKPKTEGKGKGKGRYSRTTTTNFTKDRISVTTRRNFHIIGHLTQADLSLLTDFEEIKGNFDIVNKCMVTLGKSDIVLYGHSIIFRDTLLLAPGGKRSLSAIGGMYGDHLQKINLTEDQHNNMDILMKEDPNLFKEYALRDSLISLVHACILEDAHFKLNKVGIPLTLSSLGGSNLRNSWKKLGYNGYQISRDYLLGDSSKLPTPKGLFTVGDVGLFINNYIANYKGGRNESFMIGKDDKRLWKDYDLTSAYTTAMCMLGHPNYNMARRLSQSEILDLTDNELLYSYIIIEVKKFIFDEKVTYPSIASFADEITTVYPRSGTALLTGSEYITAKNQGCDMEIQGGTLIPFQVKESAKNKALELQLQSEGSDWALYKSKAFPRSELFESLSIEKIFSDMPFREVIGNLQSERRKYEKGTISNLLYKEMGNSLYGSVTKGMSHKMKFDIKTNKTVRMEASDISNPILASWITGYVRSLLGGLLQNVEDLGGEIVSVTTDGFITDIEDLESQILSQGSSQKPLLKEYRKMREFLSGDPTALELKHEGTNLMSWTTRGQLSVEMKVKAITGLQTADQGLSETWKLISEGSQALGKTITFTTTSLRSATDIYKYGGHVTMVYRDQDFRLWYNNNRKVIEDGSKSLLSTKPLYNIEEALTLRSYSKLTRGSLYQRNTTLKSLNKYKSYLELGIRAFIKDVLNNRNGMNFSMFKSYKGLIDFIHKFVYDSGLKIKRRLDSSYVSQIKMKSLNKVPKQKMVPRLPDIMKFFNYVKATFADYDTALVLKKG